VARWAGAIALAIIAGPLILAGLALYLGGG
jgi:hypothetical protein